MEKKILTVCLNPTIQRILVFDTWNESKINRATQKMLCASGKGINVTRALQQLGSPVIHLTQNAIKDSDGFLNLCEKENLKVKTIPSPIAVRTCTTLINTQNHRITEVIEPSSPVPIQTEQHILAEFSNLIKNAHTLAICGSAAPGFSLNLVDKMTQLAKKLGVTVILDTRGTMLVNALHSRPDFIKINASEFIETFFPNQVFNEGDDIAPLIPVIQQKARELLMRYHTKTILTIGRRGCVGFDSTKNYNIPSAPLPNPLLNTVGCGDTFLAGFVHQLHKEPRDIKKALEFANECAAKSATTLKPGSLT